MREIPDITSQEAQLFFGEEGSGNRNPEEDLIWVDTEVPLDSQIRLYRRAGTCGVRSIQVPRAGVEDSGPARVKKIWAWENTLKEDVYAKKDFRPWGDLLVWEGFMIHQDMYVSPSALAKGLRKRFAPMVFRWSYLVDPKYGDFIVVFRMPDDHIVKRGPFYG